MKEPFSSADSYSTVSSTDCVSPLNKFGDFTTFFGDEPASCSEVLNGGYGPKVCVICTMFSQTQEVEDFSRKLIGDGWLL